MAANAFICAMKDRRIRLAEWGRLGRAEGIPQALDDEDQATSTSERILRGDFDE